MPSLLLPPRFRLPDGDDRVALSSSAADDGNEISFSTASRNATSSLTVHRRPHERRVWLAELLELKARRAFLRPLTMVFDSLE
jgi:hypothetical protein